MIKNFKVIYPTIPLLGGQPQGFFEFDFDETVQELNIKVAIIMAKLMFKLYLIFSVFKITMFLFKIKSIYLLYFFIAL